MGLALGTLLEDRYEILRTVTSGGMGSVYEVRDLHLEGSSCALKVMLDQLAGGEEAATFRRKFQEEARFLATLEHPGIPRVRDFFLLDGLCCIVMEFIRGQDLESELKDHLELTGGPVPQEKLVPDMIQVLEVLEYLHGQEHPVIHRDVKPANLIRDWKTGRIRLVDFGLARRLEPGSGTQTMVGTLGFCPLEQAQGRAETRSDLYALGATMHYLLTARTPTFLDVPPLSTVGPAVDRGLAEIVDRAVASDPAHRFPDAKAMRESLQAWLSRRTLAAPVVPKPAAPPEAAEALPLKRPERAKIWMGIAALALLIAGGLLGAWASSSGPPVGAALGGTSSTATPGPVLSPSASSTPALEPTPRGQTPSTAIPSPGAEDGPASVAPPGVQDRPSGVTPPAPPEGTATPQAGIPESSPAPSDAPPPPAPQASTGHTPPSPGGLPAPQAARSTPDPGVATEPPAGPLAHRRPRLPRPGKKPPRPDAVYPRALPRPPTPSAGGPPVLAPHALVLPDLGLKVPIPPGWTGQAMQATTAIDGARFTFVPEGYTPEDTREVIRVGVFTHWPRQPREQMMANLEAKTYFEEWRRVDSWDEDGGFSVQYENARGDVRTNTVTLLPESRKTVALVSVDVWCRGPRRRKQLDRLTEISLPRTLQP
ncbi:MAG: protein kinase [Armatimonadetes bacterium]|nr:protein kinase [Armatimonadota bacterium]